MCVYGKCKKKIHRLKTLKFLIRFLLQVQAAVTVARLHILPTHCSEDTPLPPRCTADLQSLHPHSQPSFKSEKNTSYR